MDGMDSNRGQKIDRPGQSAERKGIAEGPDFTRYHRDSDFRDAPEMRLDRHEGQTR
jgi:hypothetical protein